MCLIKRQFLFLLAFARTKIELLNFGTIEKLILTCSKYLYLIKMSEDKTEQAKRIRTEAIYPPRSLMDSLRVAYAIKEHNAGNPYDRLDLAKSLTAAPTTREFQSIVTSSAQFGLTVGSYVAQKISLTELGRKIVYPESVEEKNSSLKAALFRITFYKKFFEAFDGNRLPSGDFLEGTLTRTYGIPPEDTKDCYKLVLKNAKELEILEDLNGSQYVHLSKLGAPKPMQDIQNPEIPPVPNEKLEVMVPPVNLPGVGKEGITVNVTINFELPITKEADVYDKIFQSLKRNILTQDSKAN
jgi:hypothetical protein